MQTNGTYEPETIIPTGEDYEEGECLTFAESIQLGDLLPLTYDSISDRIIADRVREKLLPTEEEKAALGFIRQRNGTWSLEEEDLADRYRKPFELGEMGRAFVRHRIKDAIKQQIENDGQRMAWNYEPLWSLIEKFGLLEKAVDKVVDEGEVPSADFIIGYLERAGALDDVDVKLED